MNSESHRTLSLPKLFGYTCPNELQFGYIGGKDDARRAILSGSGMRLGSGMRAGRIVAKMHGDHVKISFLTPSSRSWFGPVYDATMEDLKDGRSHLCGKLRLTAFKTLNSIVL